MKYLSALILVIALSGCQFSPCGFNKTSFLSRHEYLVEQAKENRKKWDDKDWEKNDAAMKQFVEECYEQYEDEMSNKETSKFWTSTASYYFSRFGNGFLRELSDDGSELSLTLEKGFDSIKGNPEEILKEVFKDSGEEIREAVNELGDELKDLGEQLEEWLNE